MIGSVCCIWREKKWYAHETESERVFVDWRVDVGMRRVNAMKWVVSSLLISIQTDPATRVDSASHSFPMFKYRLFQLKAPFFFRLAQHYTIQTHSHPIIGMSFSIENGSKASDEVKKWVLNEKRGRKSQKRVFTFPSHCITCRRTRSTKSASNGSLIAECRSGRRRKRRNRITVIEVDGVCNVSPHSEGSARTRLR